MSDAPELESPTPPPGEPLEWEMRLWHGNEKKRWVALVLIIAAGFLGTWLINWVVGLLGTLVLLGSMSEILFPIRYRLDSEKCRAQCGLSVSELHWEDAKRLINEPEGVRISPLAKPSRLDATRGVYLRFSGNGESVLGKIREFWPGSEGVLGERGQPRATGGTDQESRSADQKT
jgi:hypothetical protein